MRNILTLLICLPIDLILMVWRMTLKLVSGYEKDRSINEFPDWEDPESSDEDD